MLGPCLLRTYPSARDDRRRAAGNGWDAAVAESLAFQLSHPGQRASDALRLWRGDADCLASIRVGVPATRSDFHLAHARRPYCRAAWTSACACECRSNGADPPIRARRYG